MSNILILKPFNGMFFILLALFVAGTYFLCKWLRQKPEAFRRKVLAILYAGVLALLFLYKLLLSKDAEYSALSLANGEGAFHWGHELPLHLCNINITLMIIACLLDNKRIYEFIFYFAFLGALIAMAMPSVGMSGYSILLPRMWGFWLTHFFVLFETPLLYCLGFVKPEPKEVLRTVVTFLILCVIMFIVDMLFRVTGLGPQANYFYLIETTGNPVLEIFYKIIPVTGLYVLPGVPILIVYMYIVSYAFSFFEKKAKKN